GHASREVSDHPVTRVPRPKIDRRVLVPLLIALQMAIVGLFFAAAIAAIFWTSWFEALIDYSFGGPTGTITVGILFLGLTSTGLVACVGVLFKNDMCRKIIIVISALAWYLVIPFGVALVLSETGVKSKFTNVRSSTTGGS
nr:hypothetical protein [Candidatus Sigynarchaeota archaeon]